MFNNPLNNAIVICGGICSGKSYTANLISERIKYPVASFGRFLKDYCEENNFATDRKTLQDIGEEFVRTRPQQFLNDVINHFIDENDSIIIEGVRHTSIFKMINGLAKNTISIFIEADYKTRYERYSNRVKDSDAFKTFEEFMLLDKHPAEIEIQSLKPLCTVSIDSMKPLDESFFNLFKR